MSPNSIKKQAILFENSNQAIAVFPSAGNTAGDIISGLALEPFKSIILILGAADNIDQTKVPKLTQLFGRGIARAAAEANALIIDGATQAGVAALMGEALAARGYKSQLVGIAPAALVKLPGDSTAGVPLEPNHSHFVLPEGTAWGSETATMFKLAEALAATKTEAPAADPRSRKKPAGDPAATLPSLAIVAGGGTVSKTEVLKAVRQNIPVIIIDGSGGFADEVAIAWKDRPTLPDDPVMAEIIAEGEIHLYNLSTSVKAIERLIIRELGVDQVLVQAWETFADYDYNSKLQQKQFEKLQLTIVFVGVISTALVIIQQVFGPRENNQELNDAVSNAAAANPLAPAKGIWWIIHHLLILSPILLTILLTVANRFKQGSKWLLLRAGAESIKREIFRYRTRAQDYKDRPEQQLAKKIEDITRRTMRTEVNLSALVPYNKEQGFPPYMFAAQGGDDGFSYLTPDRYVEVRLGDQLSFYQRKTIRMARLLKWLYWLTFIIGGVGTYLAAINQQVWIALTTSIVAALGTYLGYRQTESTLMKYNQAATDLSNVKSWWNALSADEQSQQENIDSLVQHTEQVLQSELDGWVQQMQNALADLRKNQEKPPVETEEHLGTEEPAAGSRSQTRGSDDTAVADTGDTDAATASTGAAEEQPGTMTDMPLADTGPEGATEPAELPGEGHGPGGEETASGSAEPSDIFHRDGMEETNSIEGTPEPTDIQLDGPPEKTT